MNTRIPWCFLTELNWIQHDFYRKLRLKFLATQRNFCANHFLGKQLIFRFVHKPRPKISSGTSVSLTCKIWRRAKYSPSLFFSGFVFGTLIGGFSGIIVSKLEITLCNFVSIFFRRKLKYIDFCSRFFFVHLSEYPLQVAIALFFLFL